MCGEPEREPAGLTSRLWCLNYLQRLAHGRPMKDRLLEKEVLARAPAEEVWRAWTTLDGIRQFFAPDARLEIRPNGPYEILFDLDAPPGRQGAEGCKVLSFVP